jgi:hypothetical protein
VSLCARRRAAPRHACARAQAIHDRFPGKLLAYNCSPSFNWKSKLSDEQIAAFQATLGELGYKFQVCCSARGGVLRVCGACVGCACGVRSSAVSWLSCARPRHLGCADALRAPLHALAPPTPPQFVTLAGFHALNFSMFTLAHDYAKRGMAAYAELQASEFAAEKHGYTATRHQGFVGTGARAGKRAAARGRATMPCGARDSGAVVLRSRAARVVLGCVA